MMGLTATMIAPGLAGADSANNPAAPVFQGDASCCFQQTGTVFGFTNYHRVGNTVSIEYHIKSGVPNSTYTVELWVHLCSYFGSVTTVTTNANGGANGNGDITVPAGSTRFFASSWNSVTGTTTLRR